MLFVYMKFFNEVGRQFMWDYKLCIMRLIEGPSGKRGHVPFGILKFQKNYRANFWHVYIIAFVWTTEIISSKCTQVNYLEKLQKRNTIWKFNSLLTKRSLNFPNGASPLFPLSPSILFLAVGNHFNKRW